MSIVGTGYGLAKLILPGEHAVVYGHPAIAMALDKRVTVSLKRTNTSSIEIEAAFIDARLQRALESLLPSGGYKVTIESDFPVGRGLGSSAALAVALVRAKASLESLPSDESVLCEQAMEIERLFHGNPSGIDHTVSARGGLLWYQKGPPLTIEPLDCPSWEMVVFDSGQAGNTAELVEMVRVRPNAQHVIQAISQLTQTARGVLHDPKELGVLLDENHRLLDRLGVSNTTLNHLAEFARMNGAFGAKLAGAGGGGVVLAITNDGHQLVSAAQENGLRAFCATIGRVS